MSLERGDLVYTLDKDGGGYYAFIYEIGVTATTYRLLYSDGSLDWVDAKNVGQMFSTEPPEVEEVEPITEEADHTMVRTRSSSGGGEILESIPLGDEPTASEHYVQLSHSGGGQNTRSAEQDNAAPAPKSWFRDAESGTLDATMQVSLTREKPQSRRKRISMRVRPKPKKTDSTPWFCCCRSKSYESI